MASSPSSISLERGEEFVVEGGSDSDDDVEMVMDDGGALGGDAAAVEDGGASVEEGLMRLFGAEGGVTETALREHARWARVVFDFFDSDGDDRLNCEEFNALQSETGSETVPPELWEDTCTAFGCDSAGFDLAGLVHGYELSAAGALEADYAAVQRLRGRRAAAEAAGVAAEVLASAASASASAD